MDTVLLCVGRMTSCYDKFRGPVRVGWDICSCFVIFLFFFFFFWCTSTQLLSHVRKNWLRASLTLK